MKKKILVLLLAVFLIGCKNDKTETKQTEQQVKEGVAKESQVTNNIYNKEAFGELKNIKQELYILDTYSKELSYKFNIGNIPIVITEEKRMQFITESTQKSSTIISIDLNNFNTDIIIANNNREISLNYEEYLKLIDKLLELDKVIYLYDEKRITDRRVSTVIYDNILVNGLPARVTLSIHNGINIIEFIDKDNKSIFSLEISHCLKLSENNKIQAINNIVLNYSKQFLEKIKDLSEDYKTLDFIVKNAKNKELLEEKLENPNQRAKKIAWKQEEEARAKEDEKLMKTNELITQKLSKEQSFKKIESDKAWEILKEKEAKFYLSTYQGGTLGPIASYELLTAFIQNRNYNLEYILQNIAQSTTQSNNKSYNELDNELGIEYNKLKNSFDSDDVKKSLVESQRQWIVFRDKEYAFYESLNIPKESIEELKKKVVEVRILDLQKEL